MSWALRNTALYITEPERRWLLTRLFWFSLMIWGGLT